MMIVALKNLQILMGNKIIFLDRDGVINHDPGDYTTSPQEFEILPDVLETLRAWTDRGYSMIVITNQGGIAKKRYSLADFERIDRKMADAFLGAGIDYLATYFCPHHDELGKCLCRKPLPGMIEKAIVCHDVDCDKSVMIGDKDRDLEAAAGAGIRGIKVSTNASLKEVDIEPPASEHSE